MHESGLTEDLFAHALHHAREANARRIVSIKVVIGALSDATPDSIRFYFDSLAPGTIAEGSALEFGTASGQAHCNACGRDVTIDEPYAACPACGEFVLAVTSGNAVYLDSIDVET
ncbi:MAG: hydrogenase maturation nickel metallochaperone HypA [Chloroflexota bacterium]